MIGRVVFDHGALPGSFKDIRDENTICRKLIISVIRDECLLTFPERLLSNRTMREITDVLEKRMSAPPAGATSKKNPAIITINDIIGRMPSITIRRLGQSTKTRLRLRAAKHGRSTEAEAREILNQVLATQRSGPSKLVESIRGRFSRLGGVELPNLRREPMRSPPRFSK